MKIVEKMLFFVKQYITMIMVNLDFEIDFIKNFVFELIFENSVR